MSNPTHPFPISREEFNLSDKIFEGALIKNLSNEEIIRDVIVVDFVKEFIKRLKQELDSEHDKTEGDLFFPTEIKDIIDKLAGEKLI